jgi:hypothetical protein
MIMTNEINNPVPVDHVVMNLKAKADSIRKEYELAYGRPCDCSIPESALHYGRAQGLEIAAGLVTAENCAFRKALETLADQADSIGQHLVYNAPIKDFMSAIKAARTVLAIAEGAKP